MKPSSLSISILFLLFSAVPVLAQEYAAGQTVFTEKKCHRCHVSGDQKKKGPSLEVIAEAYLDEDKLMSYFKGDTVPIVEPERAKLMKMRRKQLKKLSAQQQKDLSQYMMSFKK